jgi:low temperature requirement protein LtrA
MSAARSTSSQRENENTIEQGATPLELFFDLLFLFGFRQVTSFLSHHFTWTGMSNCLSICRLRSSIYR